MTSYNISPDLFTDLLFQHGIDKVYFYGPSAIKEIAGFVELVAQQNDTFGLPPEKEHIYRPLQMLMAGSQLHAHVDLDFDRYAKDLEEAYRSAPSDAQQKVLSRIRGIFEPYERIDVPILDSTAIRVLSEQKSIPDRIQDVTMIYEHLSRTDVYTDYKYAMHRLGFRRNMEDARNLLNKMETMLEAVICLASEFSKTLSAGLKISKAIAHLAVSQRDDFTPLIIDLEHFQRAASRSALERIFIR